MKKIIITIMAIIFMISFAAVPSYAGSSRKDKLKRLLFPIPVPVPIIIHTERSRDRDYDRAPKRQKRHYRSDHRTNRHRYNKRRYNQPSGHWESKRVWISPEYEERWVRGHYSNRKDRWIRGRYEQVVVREGYWKKNRIWVARY